MKTATKPTDFAELFPTRFLKAGDLRGELVTLEITSVDVEPRVSHHGENRTRAVLSFAGTQRQLEISRINGICLREMFGRSLPNWIGKRVTLGASEWRGSWFIRVHGSPDIAQDREVSIDLQRGDSFAVTLRAVADASFGTFDDQTRPSEGDQS